MSSNLGGWSIGQGMMDWLIGNVDPNTRILELGSGIGSIELSKRFRVLSVEHDPEWLAKTDGNLVVYAPIMDGWYDRRVVKAAMFSIDPEVIIVDGPPAKIGRIKFVEFFRSLQENRVRTVIFDDTDREEDWNVVEKFVSILESLGLSCSITRIQDGIKEFTVIGLNRA